MKAQRHLGNDAERPFGTDEQPGQIVAGGRLAGAARGADLATIGGDDAQPEYRLAHRAVANGVCTRCAR